MKKFFLIFTFLISYSFGFANENLSKLNNLYLNGILDKDAYFSSLKNLGINTENDIFQNLFDLFSDKTLNQENYEKSLSNLIDLSNKKNDISEDTSKNEEVVSINNSISKSYTSANCKGDLEICAFFKDKIITFTYDEGVVKWSEELKNELIETEINFAKVAKEKFSIRVNYQDEAVIFLTEV